MASPCDNTQIKYKGNGLATIYSFPFEYERQSDVVVSIWNNDQTRYVPTNAYEFANATTIRFFNAPPSNPEYPDNILIARVTNIDDMIATFFPGSSIRAQDLNDDFEQLRMAIEEGRCNFEDLKDFIDDFYVKVTDLISRETQIDGKAPIENDEVFSSAAAAARFDTYHQDATPASVRVEQPAKGWFDTDVLQRYSWDANAQAWINYARTGPPGPKGDYGPSGKVYIGDVAPIEIPDGDGTRLLEPGDLWFNSLNAQLYVYYRDRASVQWISVGVRGPEGPKGEDADLSNLTFTGVAPIIVTQTADAVDTRFDLQFANKLP